jgi:hypothetical protein
MHPIDVAKTYTATGGSAILILLLILFLLVGLGVFIGRRISRR